DTVTTSFMKANQDAMKSFSEFIEKCLNILKKEPKQPKKMMLKKIENEMSAVRLFIREIQPIMRSNLRGENPKQLEIFKPIDACCQLTQTEMSYQLLRI
ncbi:9845_t:CDS:1, partial [Ambispora gerdemannii]